MASACRSLPAELTSGGERYRIVDLPALAGAALARLPWTHRILLENVARASPDADSAREAILAWLDRGTSEVEIAFHPGRVLMHDTTCVPALVDIAAMRSALAEAGHDPALLSPVLPVDVSTDHSVGVDVWGVPGARAHNMREEFRRNAERYRFMKWATTALPGVRVHPPGTGIMHTINLERLATVVSTARADGVRWACPDTLIGTDSHTPMVNGIGVLAWGVGGLEAESVLFGMPVMLRVPDVVGVRLTGRLPEGSLATDLALAVTERLRRTDLDGAFVEFFGPGAGTLSAGERCVVANMAPEFGGASGYFPIDARTLDYLRLTGRSPAAVRLVEDYARRQGLWFDAEAEPRYTATIELDLSGVGTCIAGPKRPQDRISPRHSRAAIDALKPPPVGEPGAGEPPHGAVAIAAITSCTNTSDQRLTIAAGLLARKARQRGLRPPAWVKTSFAPGSPTAERYLGRAGLLDDLAALGFSIVGHGCTTCIGNSGPLVPQMREAMLRDDILPVAVLSGNRNFPGRVHPDLTAGFLASPPLVVAYALAGDARKNIFDEPIAGSGEAAVHLRELWPAGAEIDEVMRAVEPADVAAAYEAAEANESWRGLVAPTGDLFPWDERSTYVVRPPFAAIDIETRLGRYAARPLMVLGDDITTDHISPAGAIAPDGDAGRHLAARGEDRDDLNVYAARRGNWEVMLRGLFTNRAARNLLDPTLPAGHAIHLPSGERLPVWRVAERYRAEGVSTVLVAGERYGMGSSRDWAAKGVALLGVRAVLAVGFERIHRSNLIGMGVLPLQLPAGLDPAGLALRPADVVEIDAPPEDLAVRSEIAVVVRHGDGTVRRLVPRACVETGLEIQILRAGGIIPLILREATDRRSQRARP